MRRTLLGLLVLALATFAAPAGAARAATSTASTASGTVTGIDGVLYDDCLSYPYGYQVTSTANYWDLTTTLVGPDGRRAASDHRTMPGSGTGSFGLLCPPEDGYGRYTIHASIRWGDSPESLGDPVSLADASFTLRKPRSRTALTASTRRPAHGQRVAYRITAFEEAADGYRRAAFTWVHLERRRHGRWVRIKDGRAMTHSSGRVKVRLRYAGHHQRLRLRAVTERTSTFRRSASPVVRLW